MDEWRRWSDPKERLKWEQLLVSENPRHPFTLLWRHLSWAGIATRRPRLGLQLNSDAPPRLPLINDIAIEQYPSGGYRR